MSADFQSTASAPVLTSTQAQLYVADVAASCDFYVGKLGFGVVFIYGEPPHYAQVGRDRALFNLRHIDQPVFAGDIRRKEQLLSATVTVATKTALQQLYSIYQSRGASFLQTLRSESWGATTFILEDPDGNLILFAGPGD
jgi:catechol 2,3-dioxygenase-like lactoylglutathione lyase family enzyme